MWYVFNEAYEFNQPLNDWNVSKVSSITLMFCDAISFNQPLNKWDVKNTEMSGLFKGASNFNSLLNHHFYKHI